MSLVPRLSQGSFALAALAGFVAGGGLAPRDLFGLAVPALFPLVLLLAGAGLSGYAVHRHRRDLLLGGVALLLLGVLDTSARDVTASAVLFALALVLGLEFAFAAERANRIPDAEGRAHVMQRYLRDARVPLVVVAASVVLGAGLFLLLGPLLPGAFEASLERTSAFGVLAGALLVGLALVGYGLLRRGLRALRARRATAPAAPAPEREGP